jgi:hypothetical protein
MEQSSISSATTNYNPVERLKGEHIMMVPYVRGLYARDLPYQLWRFMEEERAIPKVFSEVPEGAEEQNAHGDLIHFVNFLNDSSKIILIAAVGEEIAGMTWFHVQQPKFRAMGNVWFRKKFWGEPAREGGRISLDYMFNCVGVEHIWGETPWMEAARYCMDIGFDYVVALPDYAQIKGKAYDAHIVTCSKENFNARYQKISH